MISLAINTTFILHTKMMGYEPTIFKMGRTVRVFIFSPAYMDMTSSCSYGHMCKVFRGRFYKTIYRTIVRITAKDFAPVWESIKICLIKFGKWNEVKLLL